MVGFKNVFGGFGKQGKNESERWINAEASEEKKAAWVLHKLNREVEVCEHRAAAMEKRNAARRLRGH